MNNIPSIFIGWYYSYKLVFTVIPIRALNAYRINHSVVLAESTELGVISAVISKISFLLIPPFERSLGHRQESLGGSFPIHSHFDRLIHVPNPPKVARGSCFIA